jgi:tetratricopeptide (TPR) repeat protein
MTTTPRAHFEELDWLDYAEGSAEPPRTGPMRDHLAECPPCRKRLESMRDLAVALPFAGDLIAGESRASDGMPSAVELDSIVLRARKDADAFSPHRDGSRREIADAFSRPMGGALTWTFSRFEAARALTRELLRSDVPLAGRIVRSALSALEKAPNREEIGRDGLEGVLRTVLAYVFHTEGESAIALEELERARPIIEGSSLVREDDFALWSYVRALALRDLGRADAALEALDTAERLYRLLEDFPRRARCQIARATILASLDRPEEAIPVYEDLLARGERELEDERLVGIIQSNLGADLIHVNRISEAKRAYARAAEIFRRTGERARLLKIRSGLAGIAMREGRYKDACETWTELRSKYRSANLGWDEIWTELRIVEALLHLDREAEAVETCKAVLPRIQELGLSREAARAVEYLTEAELNLARVEKVSRFLERARRDDAERWSAA